LAISAFAQDVPDLEDQESALTADENDRALNMPLEEATRILEDRGHNTSDMIPATKKAVQKYGVPKVPTAMSAQAKETEIERILNTVIDKINTANKRRLNIIRQYKRLLRKHKRIQSRNRRVKSENENINMVNLGDATKHSIGIRDNRALDRRESKSMRLKDAECAKIANTLEKFMNATIEEKNAYKWGIDNAIGKCTGSFFQCDAGKTKLVNLDKLPKEQADSLRKMVAMARFNDGLSVGEDTGVSEDMLEKLEAESEALDDASDWDAEENQAGSAFPERIENNQDEGEQEETDDADDDDDVSLVQTSVFKKKFLKDAVRYTDDIDADSDELSDEKTDQKTEVDAAPADQTAPAEKKQWSNCKIVPTAKFPGGSKNFRFKRQVKWKQLSAADQAKKINGRKKLDAKVIDISKNLDAIAKKNSRPNRCMQECKGKDCDAVRAWQAKLKGESGLTDDEVWSWLLDNLWERTSEGIQRQLLSLAKDDMCKVTMDSCDKFRRRFSRLQNKLAERERQQRSALNWHYRQCDQFRARVSYRIHRIQVRINGLEANKGDALRTAADARFKVAKANRAIKDQNLKFAREARGLAKQVRGYTSDVCGLTRTLNEMREILKMKGMVSHCTVSSWKPDGGCNKECGGGNQKFRRKILAEPKNGGLKCPMNLRKNQWNYKTVGCNTQGCAKNCKISAWSGWGRCFPNRNGIKKRYRKIIQGPRNGGEACRALQQTVVCNVYTPKYWRRRKTYVYAITRQIKLRKFLYPGCGSTRGRCSSGLPARNPRIKAVLQGFRLNAPIKANRWPRKFVPRGIHQIKTLDYVIPTGFKSLPARIRFRWINWYKRLPFYNANQVYKAYRWFKCPRWTFINGFFFQPGDGFDTMRAMFCIYFPTLPKNTMCIDDNAIVSNNLRHTPYKLDAQINVAGKTMINFFGMKGLQVDSENPDCQEFMHVKGLKRVENMMPWNCFGKIRFCKLPSLQRTR